MMSVHEPAGMEDSKGQTYIQQQRQSGHSLHREDEEGDHWEASAFAAPFDLLQGLFEGIVTGPARQRAGANFSSLQKLSSNVNSWSCYSQQLLQCPLLEGLIGAVDDVRLKVVRSVVLDNIADISNHWTVVVAPLKVLEKTENRKRGGG